MTEQELHLIHQLQQWLVIKEDEDQFKNQLDLEDSINEKLREITKQSLHGVSKDFSQNPVLKQYIDKKRLTDVEFWLLVASYLAVKENADQAGKQLALLNELIIKTKSFTQLMNPSLLRTLYLLNDERLSGLLKVHFPQPKATFFASDVLPRVIESDLQEAMNTIDKVRHIKKQNLAELEHDTKLVQRGFRQRQRHKQEVARLAALGNAQDVLQSANTPYQPQCADPKLSQRLVELAARIRLFSKVHYPTKFSALRDTLDQGLYSDATAEQFYLDPYLASRGSEREGNRNAIIMGVNQLEPQRNYGKDVELVFDVEQLMQDNPNIYYQQMDFSFHTLFRNLAIGANHFQFSHNVAPRMPKSGYTLMQLGFGDKYRFAEIKNCFLSANNRQDMQQILILNFFRFIDRLQTPDYQDDEETRSKIYAALNELDDDKLRETLIQIGSIMTDTALFNIHGAHQIEFSSLLTIRFKNYNLSIPALITSLQQGDLSIWREAVHMVPELFSSHRFMNYLISVVTHDKSLLELHKQAAACELPRLVKGLQLVEASPAVAQAIAASASSVQAQKPQAPSLSSLLEKASYDSKVAFLIEGATSSHPEVIAAETLARVTNSMIVDPVNQATNEVIFSLFAEAKKNSEAQGQNVDKALVLVAIAQIIMLGERTSWRVLEDTIQQLYKLCFQTEDLPEWLTTLQVETMPKLIKQFNITKAEINAAEASFAETLNYSNQLIPAKVVQLLSANPHLTSLIGLWGKFHLAAFEKQLPPGVIVSTKTQVEGYRHLQLTFINDRMRTVDVHLFGGAHGCLQAYEHLECFAKRQGLVSDQYKTAVGYKHRAGIKVKPEHHYFNVTWGRLARLNNEIIPPKYGSRYIAAWYLLIERTYGFLAQKAWFEVRSWDDDFATLYMKMNKRLKPWLARTINEIGYIDSESKQKILSQLDKLFIQNNEEVFANDLHVFIELVTAIQLFATHSKADRVEQTLAEEMYPEENMFPIELVQEYAGFMTTAQMRFFAPQASNESASSSSQSSPAIS